MTAEKNYDDYFRQVISHLGQPNFCPENNASLSSKT
jgi:hypothetical protein